MTWLLDLAYAPAALLYLPLLLYQMIVLKKNRRGWVERFGFVRWRQGDAPCVWIHAVSLGEVNATRSLVAEIHRRSSGCDIVISATTDTGYAAACRLYPDRQVFRFPLDFSFSVGGALRRIRPDAVVLMELETWPNFIRLVRARGASIGIANGRVTAGKSMRRFRLPLIRSIARGMFARISWVAAQTRAYADRFAELGVPADRIHVAGLLKYDTADLSDGVAGDGALADALGIDRSAALLVAGSTGPGEEAMLLDAFDRLRQDRPGLQLALVPRKPERFDEVARLIESRGFSWVRRSRCPDGSPAPANPAAVLLGDTMGELRKFYALANVVFVGRSLVDLGGSDVIEVAGLGRPMCFGPHMDNFVDPAALLLQSNAAARLAGPDDLAGVVGGLLDNVADAREMGRRGRDIVRANQGATIKTVDLLWSAIDADHDPMTPAAA